MKKKIIFMIINLNVGGTEKALLNMISEIPKEKYQITILMLEKYGGFLEYVPDEVTIKYLDGYENIKDIYNTPPKVSALNLIKQGKLLKAISFTCIYILAKVLNNRSIFLKYILRDCPKVYKDFDVAIAYAGPMDLISFFVLNKIEAKQKVQWIHFDVSKIHFDKVNENKLYEKFDRIFVVSQEARKKFLELLPSLNDNTEVFTNIVSPRKVNNEVKIGNRFKDNFNGIRILTIGRLTSEKGQDIAIRVLSRLIKNGYKIRWYCIGDGNSRGRYEELIKSHDLQNHFFLLGSDPNPYRYLEECDIYIQPSRHEGFCITLAEAKCLNKPIITTNFTGASEQIVNGKTGLIVGINENEIYHGVVKLIENPSLRSAFETNLCKENQLSNFSMDRFFYLLNK